MDSEPQYVPPNDPTFQNNQRIFDQMKSQLREERRNTKQLRHRLAETKQEVKNRTEQIATLKDQLSQRNRMIDKITQSCYNELMKLKQKLTQPSKPGDNTFRPQDSASGSVHNFRNVACKLNFSRP